MKKLEQLEKEILEVSEKQKNILKEIEELKANKEEEFKVGDWAYSLNDSLPYRAKGSILKITDVGNDNYLSYTDLKGETTSIGGKNFRKATVEEIEKHLIEEAEKKGFVKGAKVKHDESQYTIDSIKYVTKLGNSGSVDKYFKAHGNHLKVCSGCISVPLDECELLPSHPIIEINGWTVKFNEDSVTVGCQKIDRAYIKDLHSTIVAWNNNNPKIKFIQFSGYDVSVKQIEEIANHYNKSI